MSDMTTTCETCARLGQTPDADHLERVRTLRSIPADVQSSHWEDSGDTRGCWASHVQCAIRRVETLRAELDALRLHGRDRARRRLHGGGDCPC